MAIRHIFVPLSGETSRSHVPLCAMRLAERHKAHVTAGLVEEHFNTYAQIAPFGAGDLDERLIAALDAARKERRTTARRDFDHAVAATKLPVVSKPVCSHASTDWLAADDGSDSSIATAGVFADLIVANRPGLHPSSHEWIILEDSLFAARRPTLLLPTGIAEVSFQRPVIAWNGRAEVVRAVQGALELFEPGSKVTVLQVGGARATSLPVERLIDDLGWHGFAADHRVVADRPHQTASILLEEAKALGATVLIMGAYTRGKLRELVFGGVTTEMLKRSELPLFLAH